MKKLILAMLIGLSAGLGPALAEIAPSATMLVKASGKVLVNSGKGFKKFAGDVPVKAGDRVLVGEDSKATVKYGSCDVIVMEPSVYTILQESPCAGGVVVPADDSAAGPAGLPPAALPVVLVGGVVVSCAVFCGDLLNDNDVPVPLDHF